MGETLNFERKKVFPLPVSLPQHSRNGAFGMSSRTRWKSRPKLSHLNVKSLNATLLENFCRAKKAWQMSTSFAIFALAED